MDAGAAAGPPGFPWRDSGEPEQLRGLPATPEVAISLEPCGETVVHVAVQTPISEIVRRALVSIALVIGSWLGMQVIHECGHVVHCLATGGRILQVVLHPLEVSRTEFSSNPSPQFAAWGGVLWGSIVPLLLYATVSAADWKHAHLARFFAGFCLVANGVYFVVGSIELAADPADLVRFGANRSVVGILGGFLFVGGLRLWHGLSPSFGLGRPDYRTPSCLVVALACFDAAIIAVELLLNHRS